MKNTILLFGGGSDERLVSAASAQNLAVRFLFGELWFVHEKGAISRTTVEELGAHKNPFKEGFEPQEAPFAASLKEALPLLKGKTVFLGFHGTEGEDGTIQKLFEETGIAFTGSGSTSSRACFDKMKAKEIVSRAGISCAKQLLLTPEMPFETAAAELVPFLATHGKMILKPVANGSSVGLFIISNRGELESAVKKILSSNYGAYLAENFVQGREITVGVVERNGELQALPASEVVLNEGSTFDYEGKYLGLGSTEITPAHLTPEQMSRAQQLSLQAHRALGCYGYTRTDMILSSSGFVYLETNTLPGLTRASFIPQQLEAVKIPMREFIESQLALAKSRS